MTRPHRYSIHPVDPAAHLYEVHLTVAEPAADGQVFAMPAWIPGSYMIRDYARNVVAIRAESDGRDVTLEKLDKDRFRRDLGGVEEAYQEVARRLGVLPEASRVDLQGPKVVQ